MARELKPRSLGVGVARCRPLPRALQAMSAIGTTFGYGFLFGAAEADAPTWVCKIPPSSIEKLIPNQSVLALTARTWALQNCMSLIPKTKTGPASGFGIPSNLFILNNLAERVGFEFTRKRSFNNIERTAGTVKQWKAVVSSANGSQTDHGSVIT
jgi:hypothetical protein